MNLNTSNLPAVVRDARDGLIMLFAAQAAALVGEAAFTHLDHLPYAISIFALGSLAFVTSLGMTALGALSLVHGWRRLTSREGAE